MILRDRPAAVFTLLILSLLASWPLFHGGWFISHESTEPIERLLAYANEMRQGNPYPRWLSDAYFGKGSPFPIFYSPGFYFVGAALHALGADFLVTLKAGCMALFFLGAGGMYLWAGNHLDTWGALTSAVLYLFAPYHFVDLYIRGAMAEFTALAFLPFLFYGIDRTFSPANRRTGIATTALASAAILLSHQLSALMIAPFATAYFLWSARGAKAGFRRTLAAMAGPVAGAGLSAFYWLPVLVEKPWLRDLKSMVTGDYFSYALHFVYPSQWFSPSWGFGSSNPGTADGMSFQIGLVLSLFAASSVIALAVIPSRNRRFGVVTVASGIAALFMTASPSAPIYAILPGLEFIQFPWRFLGPATLFLSAAGGIAVALSAERGPRFLAPCLSCAAIVLCIVFSQDHRAVSGRIPIPDTAAFEDAALRLRQVGPLTRNDEYLPIWAKDQGEVVMAKSPDRPFARDAAITGLSVAPSAMAFSISAGRNPAAVMVPWYYFPGWRVRLDGIEIPCGPDPNGFVAFTAPPGRHEITLRFDGTTWDRLTGWAISALALAALALSLIRENGTHAD